MPTRKEIAHAWNVEGVSETYQGNVQITDLQEELGTQGHVLVVRGDLAYSDRLTEGEQDIATPKLWLYENLINSPRVQEQLRKYPNHKLFDGVGFSSLDALGWHAKQLGRRAVVVMGRNHVPDKKVFDRYDIEVISADEDGEEGYVKKQAEVLSQRDNLIPLHQALYGAQALAPVGNKIIQTLEAMCVAPDKTFWCSASGSNLYGIGSKIKEKFGSKTMLVEPEGERTVDPKLDLGDSSKVKAYAKDELRNYTNDNWSGINSGIFPLHVAHANRYLLMNWFATGDAGFDRTKGIHPFEVTKTQRMLKKLNPDYNWTNTTGLTLVPAIEAARKGEGVLVMAYGKHKKNKSRGWHVINSPPWIARWETPAQKVASVATSIGYAALAGLVTMDGFANVPDEVARYMPFIG